MGVSVTVTETVVLAGHELASATVVAPAACGIMTACVIVSRTQLAGRAQLTTLSPAPAVET